MEGDVLDESEPQVSERSNVPSLLERLKWPAKSDLARKRKVKVNRGPSAGIKQCKRVVASEPNVSPAVRVKEYLNELLTVSSGKLFYKACRESITVKKSVIDCHIRYAKHAAGIKHIEAKRKGKKV